MSLSPEIEALAGEYALGLLEGAERRAAEDRMAKDEGFRAAVAGWQQHLIVIDETAPTMQPTPTLWMRIEQGIKASPARARNPVPARRAPFWGGVWNSLALWRPVGIAGALASLVLAVVLAGRLSPTPALPSLVAVLSSPDGRPAAIVNAYADGTVQLVPIDPVAVPEGWVLEVWTLQDRSQGPVSLAKMDRARTIKLDLTRLSPAEVGHIFEITLEPAGGSPTGRPTGPVLMKGLAATRL